MQTYNSNWTETSICTEDMDERTPKKTIIDNIWNSCGITHSIIPSDEVNLKIALDIILSMLKIFNSPNKCKDLNLLLNSTSYKSNNSNSNSNTNKFLALNAITDSDVDRQKNARAEDLWSRIDSPDSNSDSNSNSTSSGFIVNRSKNAKLEDFWSDSADSSTSSDSAIPGPRYECERNLSQSELTWLENNYQSLKKKKNKKSTTSE